MSRVTIDDAIRAKLNGLNEDLELCDENGNILGHFLPQREYLHLMILEAEAQCPYTKEQLEEFRKEKGGRKLSEIWKSLGVT